MRKLVSISAMLTVMGCPLYLSVSIPRLTTHSLIYASLSSLYCLSVCLIDYDAEEDIEFTQTEDIEVLSSFDTMGLKEDLLRGIYAYGTASRQPTIPTLQLN